MGNGLVYFVTYSQKEWREALPVIKIGYTTTSLKKRLAHLSISSPINLIVAGAIWAKAPDMLEHQFHKQFKNERLNGEWFLLNPRIINEIRRYDIVDDRFNELFDFEMTRPSARDTTILALQEEVKRLTKELGACQNELEKARLNAKGVYVEHISHNRTISHDKIERKFMSSIKYHSDKCKS